MPMPDVASDAPESAIPEVVAAGLTIASAERRLANFLLDTLLLFPFAFAVAFLLALLGLGSVLYEVNIFVLNIIFVFLYYGPLEAANGRSLAKWITRTKVVSVGGGPISIAQAVVRTACRFIPFEPFSVLANGAVPRGWHDSIPKTYVVSLAKA
jgi:uncharacterized RDD family membrane protein YckC